jgi:hypothetical protein
MIGQELRTFLINYQNLNDLVGSRIYPMKLPQDPTFPAVTYHEISSPEHHDIPVAYPTYQFSCWAERYGEATEVAKQVKNALQRYKGMMGETRVKQGVYEGKQEIYEPETGIYHFPVDVKIIYRSD